MQNPIPNDNPNNGQGKREKNEGSNLPLDIITIIAPSIKEAMRQFQQRGLDKLGYTIEGKIVRQQFDIVDNEQTRPLFEGRSMYSATWIRKRAI